MPRVDKGAPDVVNGIAVPEEWYAYLQRPIEQDDLEYEEWLAQEDA